MFSVFIHFTHCYSNFNYGTLMAESEEELKSLLMKVKEESGKSWLKTQDSEY